MRVTYNKLVRDRVPEIIREDGHRAVTRVLDHDGFLAELLAKLVEEAQEARAASAADLPAELADVLEVMQSAVTAAGRTWDELDRGRGGQARPAGRLQLPAFPRIRRADRVRIAEPRCVARARTGG